MRQPRFTPTGQADRYRRIVAGEVAFRRLSGLAAVERAPADLERLHGPYNRCQDCERPTMHLRTTFCRAHTFTRLPGPNR